MPPHVQRGARVAPPHRTFLFAILALALAWCAVMPVSAVPILRYFDADDEVQFNQTYLRDESNATPFIMWAGAVILGLVLVVLSFLHFPHSEEVYVSILSWIPIGYAAYTAFAVSMLSASGVTSVVVDTATKEHEFAIVGMYTIHSFTLEAVLLIALLIFAMANSWRIYTNSQNLKKMSM